MASCKLSYSSVPTEKSHLAPNIENKKAILKTITPFLSIDLDNCNKVISDMFSIMSEAAVLLEDNLFFRNKLVFKNRRNFQQIVGLLDRFSPVALYDNDFHLNFLSEKDGQ